MKRTSSALLLVLPALAGCTSSGDSFEEAYNRAARPLTQLGSGVGTRPADFERLAERTERTRANLATLEPPDEARDELDRLLRRLRAATRDLTAVAEAARRTDLAEQRDAAERLVRSSAAVQRAERALQRAVGD